MLTKSRPCDGLRDLKGLYNIDGFLKYLKHEKKLELVSRQTLVDCELCNVLPIP